jgi:hypothetical protein
MLTWQREQAHVVDLASKQDAVLQQTSALA